jgi:hypothetical protein
MMKVRFLVALLVLIALVAGSAQTSGSPALFANESGIHARLLSPSIAGAGSSVNTLYLTTAKSSIYQHAWNLSGSPNTSAPANQTSIYLNTAAAQSGFALFSPGVTNSTTFNSTIPVPSKSAAYGWLSSSAINCTTPAGNWTIQAALTLPSSSGLSGSILLGASLYSSNTSNGTFSRLMNLQNSSNIVNMSKGIHYLSLSRSSSSFTFKRTDHLFVEFYLNLSSFSTLGGYTIVLNVGGNNDSSYFVRYPYFGWLHGSVTPTRSSVTVDSQPVTVSPSGSFNITLAPGNYVMNVTLSGYQNFTSNVSVSSGFSSAETVVLKKLYAVTILEQGLKEGTQWSVDLNGSSFSQSTNYSLFKLVNGTYSLLIPSVPGYRVGPYPLSFIVRGSNQSLLVNFTLATFDVTFEETGLSGGTIWNVTVSNSTFTANYEINSTFRGILLPNGTYNYSVMKVRGYSSSPSRGSFTVKGNATTVNVAFVLVFYRITFVESGLPSSATWSVTLDGITKFNDSSTITFYETVGSYNYTIGTVKGYSSSVSSRTVTVDSGNVTISVAFAATSGGGNSLFLSKPLNLFYFAVLLIILVQIEIMASFYYFRRNRGRNGDGGGKKKRGADGKSGTRTERQKPVSEMVEENSSGADGGVTSAIVSPSLPLNDRSNAENGQSSAKEAMAIPETVSLATILEYGNSFAFFEEKAERSVQLFEIGLKRGLKGLCFTREYPEKLRQKHDLGDATVVWLSNIGSQDAIRPKDLEKITLQCNELLASSQSVILIDGLEYLITNNGFISVLKLLQFLRDATAVNRSVLIISINQHAIKDSEVSLIRREVDRIVE